MNIKFQAFIDCARFYYQPDPKSSKFGTQRHFTIISNGATICTIGLNFKAKTHPLAKRYKHRFYAIHSELHAISRFPYPPTILDEYDFFNVRLNSKLEVLLAKPCLQCQKMLKAFGVDRIYWTTNSNKIDSMKL
jgi:deoxycytidylate deaminase